MLQARLQSAEETKAGICRGCFLLARSLLEVRPVLQEKLRVVEDLLSKVAQPYSID